MRVVGPDSVLGGVFARWSCFRSKRSFVYSKLAQAEPDDEDLFVLDTHGATSAAFKRFDGGVFFDSDEDDEQS